MPARRILGLIAALVLTPSLALAALTEEAFERWYDRIAYLTEEIGTRTVGSLAYDLAYHYLIEEYQRAGMDYDDQTLWESGCIANGYDTASIV